jgi:hypothetical protein
MSMFVIVELVICYLAGDVYTPVGRFLSKVCMAITVSKRVAGKLGMFLYSTVSDGNVNPSILRPVPRLLGTMAQTVLWMPSSDLHYLSELYCRCRRLSKTGAAPVADATL